MFRFPTSPIVRRRLGHLSSTVFVGVTGLALVECSSSGSPVQDPNAPITIQTSQASVVIENKVGMPLVDVEVTILPAGAEFKKIAGRVENTAKREIVLGDFRSRDGTPFSLRLARPRSVRVTAKDLNNKTYTVEAPWK